MKQLKLNECTILESSNTIFFDVDDTLILWGKKHQDGRLDVIKIKDPFLRNHFMFLTPHIAHINILKRNKAQGRTVIVWSAAGHLWAQAVVKALKLEKYVSLILDKPTVYVDDIPMDKWFPKRIYLENDIEADKNDESK